MTPLEQAREAAASHFPDHLIDTKGRKHPCIPKKRILSGDWDDGSLVKSFLEEMEKRA